MKWVIDKYCRIDIKFYSGINCSGDEAYVKIHPSGMSGKRQEITFPIQSLKLAGWPGIGIYLCTSDDDEDWVNHPWRCVRITKRMDNSPKSTLVRVHDLDLFNPPQNLALPVGAGESFPLVDSPEEGTGFTFGKGAGQLKSRIRMIRVFKHQD